MSEEKLTKALYVRVSPNDVERLDKLSERITVVSKNGIARAAMRLGMDVLEVEPQKILETSTAKQRSPKRR